MASFRTAASLAPLEADFRCDPSHGHLNSRYVRIEVEIGLKSRLNPLWTKVLSLEHCESQVRPDFSNGANKSVRVDQATGTRASFGILHMPTLLGASQLSLTKSLQHDIDDPRCREVETLTPFAAVLSSLLCRRRRVLQRVVRLALGYGLAVNELIWWAFRYSHEGLRFPVNLPLQLCDVTLWATVLACITLVPVLIEFAHFAHIK
jgi:hypothetical protein